MLALFLILVSVAMDRCIIRPTPGLRKDAIGDQHGGDLTSL